MASPIRVLPASRIVALVLGLAVASVPAGMADAAQARLTRCGADTCLLLSGRRAGRAVVVGIAGHDLAVVGDHAWHMSVPLSTARDWPGAQVGMLRLTLTDPASGTQTADAAALPPGALGRRIELATLVVRAH